MGKEKPTELKPLSGSQSVPFPVSLFSFSLGEGYNASLLDTKTQHMLNVEFKEKQQRERRKTE